MWLQTLFAHDVPFHYRNRTLWPGMLIALWLSSSNAALLGRTESSEGPDIDRSKWERDLSQR